MIKVLGRKNSINVQKVMWCAAELGVSVERKDVGGAFVGNDTPEYLAKNPNGKIPVLEDGEFVLWESNSIVRYLAETDGTAPWYPDETQTRAEANQWMDWYLTSLNPPMFVIFWNLIRTAPEERDMEKVEKATAEAATLFRMLDDRLAARDFVTGAEPCMGDIPVGCATYRWFAMDVARPDLPNLESWYARLRSRPAFQEHVMIPLT